MRVCVRVSECGVQLCTVSKANEMIFNGCFVLQELKRLRTKAVHKPKPMLKSLMMAATALCILFRRQPKWHEKNFLFQYIWSVGRFSEANDKSLFPNPFNIYTSVMLTRRRCHTLALFLASCVSHLADSGAPRCFREQPKMSRIQHTFSRNNNNV